MAGWIIGVIVIGLFAIAAIVLWAVRGVPKKPPEGPPPAWAPVKTCRASVKAKEVREAGPPVPQVPYQIPEHPLEYRVLFRLDSGEERWMTVPKECYEELPLGEQGELLAGQERFFDFNGRFGRDDPGNAT